MREELCGSGVPSQDRYSEKVKRGEGEREREGDQLTQTHVIHIHASFSVSSGRYRHFWAGRSNTAPYLTADSPHPISLQISPTLTSDNIQHQPS